MAARDARGPGAPGPTRPRARLRSSSAWAWEDASRSDCYDPAVRPVPFLAAAVLVLGPVARPAASQEAEPSVAERMEAGRDALKAGDHETAEELFRGVTRLAPDLVPAWLGASLAVAGGGDRVGALALARSCGAGAGVRTCSSRCAAFQNGVNTL